VPTIPPLPPTSPVNKSEILYGVENAVGRGVYFMSNVKQRMDIFFDHSAPSIVVDVEEYRNGYIDIRRRGAKIRAFTEITKDNVQYCKELMKLVDELRHLDGVRGGVAVSESEYMATTVLQEAKPLTQVIYSNVKEVVEQGQYIFDTLWNASVSAEHKIREIEQGIIPYETRIIENNPDEIVKQIRLLTENSNKLSICLTSGGMQYSHNYFFDIKKKLLDKQKNGEHKGIRYISNIDKDNIQLAKEYLQSGIQIRHVKNLPPMSFGVSDKEMAATIEKMEGGKRVESLLISNEPAYVRHFSSIFEELWNNGIEAADRIREIEEGIKPGFIETIRDPTRVQNIAFELVKSSKEEILTIFSTSNAFFRQERVGGIALLNKAAKDSNRNVRILVPYDAKIEKLIKSWEISNNTANNKDKTQKIIIRFLDPALQTKISLLIVDRKSSLAVELKDDTQDIIEHAIGLSSYSNSKSTVLTYVSIFETLWKQTEMYEQLKVHDKMQKEFINIAAHELRTPVQPILGLSEILQSKVKDKEQLRLLDVISRNAKRLQNLTENILDVTKIESDRLKINRKIFNLNDTVTNLLADYKKEEQSKTFRKIKLFFSGNNDKSTTIYGDKERITQVISNLLSNAIKFTDEGGEISLHIKRQTQHVIVSVRDNGQGIAPEIYPRLFTKFATNSVVGTGLGLYISKNIIEAHGGRIWAENNLDGKGASFSFVLPILNP
jgi:two-component system, OmpR family, sensor histidine kinase VicK